MSVSVSANVASGRQDAGDAMHLLMVASLPASAALIAFACALLTSRHWTGSIGALTGTPSGGGGRREHPKHRLLLPPSTDPSMCSVQEHTLPGTRSPSLRWAGGMGWRDGQPVDSGHVTIPFSHTPGRAVSEPVQYGVQERSSVPGAVCAGQYGYHGLPLVAGYCWALGFPCLPGSS